MSPSPQGVVAAAVVLPCFATLAVGGRLYARRLKKTSCGSDDWLVVLALVLTWALGILLITGSAIGSFGGHTAIDPETGADVITSKERNAVKFEVISYLVLVLTLGVAKLSVLLLYRRLFVGSFFNRYSLTMSALVLLWSLSFMFAYAFQCGTKLSYFWTSAATIERYCDNSNAIDLGFVVSDVMTDLLLLATPLPIIWRLQLSTPQRIGLCGTFLLGLLSVAAGIVRMAMIVLNEYFTSLGYRDLKGDITNLVVWGTVEAGAAVIAACLPTMRPLFQGKSPESLMGSIRSKLSLRSMDRSLSPRRHDSDTGGLTVNNGLELGNLKSVGSKS